MLEMKLREVGRILSALMVSVKQSTQKRSDCTVNRV
jgi:hypothetical protein